MNILKIVLSLVFVVSTYTTYSQKRIVHKNRQYKITKPSNRVIAYNRTCRASARTIRNYKTYRYNNLNYYRSGGIYYTRVGNTYRVTRTPIGLSIWQLPLNSRRIVYRNCTYFYNQGVFYRSNPNGYIIVKAPLGIRINNLPNYVQRRICNNVVYYQANDIYYRWLDRERCYTVVRNPFV